MTKPRRRTFPIDLYRSTFTLAIASSVKEAVAVLPPTFRLVDNSDNDDSAGLMLADGVGGFAVCLSSEHLDHNTLVHELFHVTIDMLTRVNVRVDSENDEAASHLIGWLTELSVEQIKKWRIKI